MVELPPTNVLQLEAYECLSSVKVYRSREPDRLEEEDLLAELAEAIIQDRDNRFTHMDDIVYALGPPKDPEGKNITATLLLPVFTELHKALCRGDDRYTEEVQMLSSGSKMLIAAITGYLASSLGLAPAVIAAMVSAGLVFASKIGLNAWCEWMSEIPDSPIHPPEIKY